MQDRCFKHKNTVTLSLQRLHYRDVRENVCFFYTERNGVCGVGVLQKNSVITPGRSEWEVLNNPNALWFIVLSYSPMLFNSHPTSL